MGKQTLNNMKICSSFNNPILELSDDNNTDIKFKDFNINDIAKIKHYLELNNSRSCDFSVGGILIWADLFKYQYAELHDSLIIKGFIPERGLSIFYEPLGKMSHDELRNLVSEINKRSSSDFKIIKNEEIECNPTDIIEDLDENYLPEFKEYLYPIEKFCDFPGKKMEKKRNHLHYFQKNYYPFEIGEINKEITSKLIDFTKKFEFEHEKSVCSDYECQQIENVLDLYDMYPFEGIYISKDGEILGYSFGEIINDTFIIHAEKGNTAYRGVYQAIASEMAKLVALKYPQVRYLNREDDMGDEHLRQSKMSYHPTLFIQKRLTI